MSENTNPIDTLKSKIRSDRSDSNIENSKSIVIKMEIDDKTKPEGPEKCLNCDKMIDPYDKNTHPSCCSGRMTN